MKSNTTATLLQHSWMVLKSESKYAMNYVYKHFCRNWYWERKLKSCIWILIFIRQYRTRAGNHCNCCFIIIFENVLEYVLFGSDFFLSYLEWIILDRSIYHVMTATQNSDSTIGRWKTEPKQDTLFLARNCRGCKLSPPAQTNKLRRSEEQKLLFCTKQSSFC